VLGSGESGFVAGTYLFEKIVVNCDDGKHVNKFRDRMEEGCAAHGMKPACYTHSLPAQYSLTCINHGGKASVYPSGFQAVQDHFQLNTGFCASSVWLAPNNALCGMASGMTGNSGCPTYSATNLVTKYLELCAKKA